MNRVSKEMQEIIGICYLSAMDISPEVKILSTRRLLTLLSGATKLNGETQYKQIIIDGINTTEEATELYSNDEQNWAYACFLCNKVLDKLTPIVFGGYAIFKDTNKFSLQSVPQSQGDNKQ